MPGRLLKTLLFLCVLVHAAVPTPKDHLGYIPGDDYKLADYADVAGYFRKLAAASNRIRLEEFGRSANGKPMLVAYISSPENLANLDKWKQISQRLALGRATREEARIMSRAGRAIVWIDSGLHASEVAPVQQSFDLAYRMITQEDDETRLIRDRVILLQIPVINPDGLDWIAHWYRKNVGTPYELAPLPHLYHKYAGHDNNRDWFMMNLEETRHVSRMLFAEWFPQIVYNQHQTGPFPARIFVPPYGEPLNPNIPAPVMEGINLIGAAMKERFARENKPGVISYTGYDAWWNGGLRSVPAFHNMHGILTETALFGYATPGEYKLKDLPERFANGIPTKEPSVFYERPWLGGRWALRDAVDYMLTADWAILELAAARSEQYLFKAWELALAQIDAGNLGKPYAYVIPPEQWDASAAADLLERLSLGGIEIRRATDNFQAGGKTYPAGSYVISVGQPFRGYLVDLMEPQKYPELRTGVTGPTKRPYDVAGWTLPMSMGVNAVRIDTPFQAALEPATRFDVPVSAAQDPHQNASYLAKAAAPGRKPRVALYEPYTANMDTGWTQYVLERFKIPHQTIHNEDFATGALGGKFDAIILASQPVNSILHGTRNGEPAFRDRGGPADRPALQRPEFTGGIGVQGLAALEGFVRQGGTLIVFDEASAVPVQFFPLPVRPILSGAESGDYYSPGSIIRIQVDTTHPLAAGMPKEAYAFTTGGQAWDISLLEKFNLGEREVRSVARYADAGLLASGWISGERAVLGKHILLEARHGKGRVILFGFRPQFRAQTTGTFKFILNAIYSSVPSEKL
jgi:hypothetical protein